jgi:hypothetical protein
MMASSKKNNVITRRRCRANHSVLGIAIAYLCLVFAHASGEGPSPRHAQAKRDECTSLRANRLIAFQATSKRMFTLGHRAGKVPARPPFPSIRVRNTRSGFFEEEQLRAVLDRLGETIGHQTRTTDHTW